MLPDKRDKSPLQRKWLANHTPSSINSRISNNTVSGLWGIQYEISIFYHHDISISRL